MHFPTKREHLQKHQAVVGSFYQIFFYKYYYFDHKDYFLSIHRVKHLNITVILHIGL